jgi:hypothetical protein
MLMEKPRPTPAPELSDDEVAILRRYLRTVILRATWSDEADHRRRLASAMYDVWKFWPRQEAEFLWSVERKIHIEGMPPDDAVRVLLNRIHLHLVEPVRRQAA